MSRKGEVFAGLTVALVTPYRADGSIDFAEVDRLVDWHVEQGTDCLAPAGTTGESPTLDHEEHRQLIARVVRRAAGRIRTMPGTGSNSTREAVDLTKFAQDAGADGVLMVAPYYNKPTQDGYLAHFEHIANQTSVPIVLYNIPGRTGSNMEPPTINRLGEHPNIVAVKEATGSMDQASQILAGSKLTVLSGDDSLTLPLMALGGSGIVSVVGNIVPRDIQSVVRSFQAGNLAAAQQAHYRLFPLCRDMLSLATNPIPVKAAMKLLGQGSGALRLPMTPLDDAKTAKLRQTLVAYGLLG